MLDQTFLTSALYVCSLVAQQVQKDRIYEVFCKWQGSS